MSTIFQIIDLKDFSQLGIMGFSDVQVTDSAIYTVFHGTSFKEIEDKAEGFLMEENIFMYLV